MMDFDQFRPADLKAQKKPQEINIPIDTIELEDHEMDAKQLMEALWIDIGGEG